MTIILTITTPFYHELRIKVMRGWKWYTIKTTTNETDHQIFLYRFDSDGKVVMRSNDHKNM